ncbi:MAG: CCDC90 family protein [Pseudomonadota bacterium]|nr:CCDC90 family protein [Pseudomonadota bacterium]
MASVTFDTLKFVERPKAAGVPEAQAKALAEA